MNFLIISQSLLIQNPHSHIIIENLQERSDLHSFKGINQLNYTNQNTLKFHNQSYTELSVIHLMRSICGFCRDFLLSILFALGLDSVCFSIGCIFGPSYAQVLSKMEELKNS